MQPDQVNNTEITLTNTGGGVINYSIEFQDTSRDITGSNVTCSSEYFTPGETIELSFTATNQSTDSEWIHGVDITFPDGFTVTGATDFTGGTSPMVYDGSAGNAAVVGWWGETGSGYGVLQDGDSAEATVTVEVAADYSGDAVLAWTLFGDNYGAEPHQVSGEMTLESYGGAVSWISASQLGGDLFAQQSDVITLEFDTADLEEGIYTCNMIVSYNETEETIVPIVLTISSSAADENSLPLVTDSYIYPNPFYRNQRSSSRYCFTLSENVENAEVAVYNIKGQKIADIYNGNLSAGEHQLSWQAEDNIAAGVYFYIMSSKGQSAAEKFIILK